MIIGLTGNIASGKSTVAKYLSDLGAKVIDADQIARKVVMPNTPALKDIVNFFGQGVLHADGSLNRKKLGALVFDNAAARKKLEDITHPRIDEEINREISLFKELHPNGIVVLEVPLLIEVGWHKKVDQVWLVTVDEHEQLTRLMHRDNLTYKEARQRIASQMPQEEKLRYADVVIDNSRPPHKIQQQLKEIWQQINSGYV